MELSEAKIEELKRTYPEGIFESEIRFDCENEIQHTVEFVYRKPTTADLEAHGAQATKNPIVANLNLLASLIIYPDPGPIIEKIREYPVAYGRFVDECIVPFYGANVQTKRKKL